MHHPPKATPPGGFFYFNQFSPYLPQTLTRGGTMLFNPNLKELGSNLAFNPDGSINLDIASCLTCSYFTSYRDESGLPDELPIHGRCVYPFMEIDETYGIGMICDLYTRNQS